MVDTWARQNKPEDTKKLADSIISAANESDAIVLPVGLAFAESLKQRPDLVMHQKIKAIRRQPVLTYTVQCFTDCSSRRVPRGWLIWVNARNL